MKVRKGFVSNSSSSSFIVAVDKDKNPKIKVTMETDLSELVQERITSKEELDTYFLDTYAEAGTYSDMLRKIEEGKVVMVCACSNEDDENLVSIHLYDKGVSCLEDNPDIEIID